ncbi:uncharacterized protein LOC111085903 [Limulus polyphemus]|uniref:Uncharacterized protein LOC111085903 n=1 Tax=Limulus polyphemus TaxID=6850 RepID=A0ABM1SFK9_LIMPO|nr:uncharacterized protein LOC111085903 [Limulus polyphemus]
MDSLKRPVLILIVTLTVVESIWGLIWSLWAVLLLENPQSFINGKNNTVEIIAESFKKLLSQEDVHFGFILFEMILSIFWTVCGFSLLYGYLKKKIIFVIPWIMTTFIVILYDISTSIFYLNLLVGSLKKETEDSSVETISNNSALFFLILGFSRFGIIFLCINVTLFYFVIRSTREYRKIKNEDLLDSTTEPDLRSQFQLDERCSPPRIPRWPREDNIRQPQFQPDERCSPPRIPRWPREDNIRQPQFQPDERCSPPRIPRWPREDNIPQLSSSAHNLPHSSRESSTRDLGYIERYYDDDASRSAQERPRPHTNMLPRGRLEPSTNMLPRGRLEHNTNMLPRERLEPNTNMLPRGRLEPNTNMLPRGSLEHNTNMLPHRRLEPNTNMLPRGSLEPETGMFPRIPRASRVY